MHTSLLLFLQHLWVGNLDRAQQGHDGRGLRWEDLKAGGEGHLGCNLLATSSLMCGVADVAIDGLSARLLSGTLTAASPCAFTCPRLGFSRHGGRAPKRQSRSVGCFCYIIKPRKLQVSRAQCSVGLGSHEGLPRFKRKPYIPVT